MKEFINKHSKVISLLLIVFLVSLFGLTFAYTMQDIGVNIASGNYNVIYSGSATLPTGTLNPVVDSSISATTSSTDVMKVTFSVKGAQSNPTDIPIIYDVTLTDLDMPSELRHPLLKWRLYKNSNLLYEGSFEDVKSNRYILTSTQQNLPTYSASPDNYVFIIWISEQCTGDITTCSVDDSNDISGLLNKSFSGKIRIELSTKGKTIFDRNALAYQTLDNLGLTSSIKSGTPDFTKGSPEISGYIDGVKKTEYTRANASNYYYTYADSYTFSLSGYTLTSPSVGKYSDIYKSLIGKYVVSEQGNTSSSAATSTNKVNIYYVVDATYDSSSNEGKITYIMYNSITRTSSESLYRYTASDSYTFDSSTGKFSLDNPSVLQYSTNYSNLINKYIVNYVGSSSTTAAISTNLIKIYKILDTKYTSGASTPGRLSYVEYTKFVSGYDYSSTGIFVSEDDIGTSYYFRGDVTNNYVKFAGFYWRIVRINGDGTIRIVYDGTSAHANNEETTDRQVDDLSINYFDDNGAVGFAHGMTSSSAFPNGSSNSTSYEEAHANNRLSKIARQELMWLERNITNTTNLQYIADAIYCNDRSIASGLGYGKNATSYAFEHRANIGSAPTLKCSQKNDRFTLSSTLGNGFYYDPEYDQAISFGLLTADELVFAGAPMEEIQKNGGSSSYDLSYENYLYNGDINYWTMTPLVYVDSAPIAVISYKGTLAFHMADIEEAGLRPVISLKSDALTKGTGTMNDPFTIS